MLTDFNSPCTLKWIKYIIRQPFHISKRDFLSNRVHSSSKNSVKQVLAELGQVQSKLEVLGEDVFEVLVVVEVGVHYLFAVRWVVDKTNDCQAQLKFWSRRQFLSQEDNSCHQMNFPVTGGRFFFQNVTTIKFLW